MFSAGASLIVMVWQREADKINEAIESRLLREAWKYAPLLFSLQTQGWLPIWGNTLDVLSVIDDKNYATGRVQPYVGTNINCS